MPPAARITDNHVCPMVNPGPVPHVGGPVVLGSFNVFTGKLPQARVGDMLVCVGPPDAIAKGSSGVFVNKKPAARLGDQTAHGGVIVVGLPTVIIGEQGGGGGGSGAPTTGVSSNGFVGGGLAALGFAQPPMQAQVLKGAAVSGAPFCEVCFNLAKQLNGAVGELAQGLAHTPSAQNRSYPPSEALATAGPPPLGKLSSAYETSGRGAGTVSSGVNDRGGVSYGSYQLASNLGRPEQFLATDGAKWKDRFAGLKSGSAEFSSVWKAVASEEPAAFEAAQHRYIARTHFEPFSTRAMEVVGLDVGGASNAVQQAVWSTAVQHGKDSNVLINAVNNMKKTDPNLSGYTEEKLISALYDERGAPGSNGMMKYFTDTPVNSAKAISLRARFASEKKDAIRMLSE